MISVIIINYNSTIKMLDDCIQSYINQEGANPEIIVYDNNSKNLMELKSYEQELRSKNRDTEFQFIYSDKNLGFAKAVNNSVKASRKDYVFISNFDIQVKKDALKQALDVMQKYPGCAGIASKVFFMHDKNLLDNIGTCIDSNGSAFNRGVGLYDLGQYDAVERVFGICFGACLIRRELFDTDKVGLLDESYFMYYEDVDWCYRANILGYSFYSAPDSVVYHYHSQSVRNLKYGFKFKLIERNLLYTIIKNFELKHAVRILIRRGISHAKTLLLGKFRIEVIMIYLGVITALPKLLAKRLSLNKKKVMDDFHVFFLSYYELPFFAPMEYAPILSLNALIFLYKRLYLLKGEKRHYDKLVVLELLNSSNLKFKTELLYDKLKKLFENEPEEIMKYLENFKKGKGIF